MKNKLKKPINRGGVRALLLLVLMLVGATQAKAQTYYGFNIAGTQVTSENYQNLSNIKGVSGTITYNGDKLTLKNATIIAELGNGFVNNSKQSLNIVLEGTNKIIAYSSDAMLLHCNTNFKGSGTLEVRASRNSGIQLTSNSTLALYGSTLNVYGNNYGITGNGGNEILAMQEYATLTAEGKKGSICDIVSFFNTSSIITSPEGAAFDNTMRCFAVNGDTVTEKIVIEKIASYGFNIAGKTITTLNYKNLSKLHGVNGTIEYDREKNILTLDNAAIDYSNIGIENTGNEGLIIELKGENTITTGLQALKLYKSTTIRGGGTLNATADGFSCISSENKDAAIVIDSCNINAKAERSGIGATGNVTIRNANITTEGAGASFYAASLTLIGCEIVEPDGAAFNGNTESVAVNGKSVNGKVVIKETEKSYGIWIGNTKVTNYNRKDLSSIPGVSGTVEYDPNTSTLYLDNATINFEGESWGIISDIPLIIHVTGENNLRAAYSIVASKVIGITGDGIFNIETNGFDGYCVRLENSPLYIIDCTVNIKGPTGIYGQGGTNSISISNSEVTVEGSSYGSIVFINAFELFGCSIIQPSGATFDESMKAVVLNGAEVTDKIVIGKTYDIVFVKCAATRAQTVKLVKDLTGLGLKESNDIVNAAPCIMLENVSQEEAIAICEKFAALGSTANYYPHGTWTPVGIEKVKATSVPAHKKGIYSIDGVYLGTDFDALPKGIYIKDGKKVKK